MDLFFYLYVIALTQGFKTFVSTISSMRVSVGTTKGKEKIREGK